MTYARARLWLGITGVGFWVVVASLALYWDWPALLPNNGLSLAALVGVYMALHFPLDYMGGYWLPCRFSRQCQMFSLFISQYLRGALLQGVALLLSALLILQAGQWGGRVAVVLLLGLIMLAMVEWQHRIAQWVGGFSYTHRDGMIEVEGYDPGFAGGIVGLPGREQIVLPRLWQRILPANVVRIEELRRIALRQTGSRTRGLLVAMAWNLGGFYLSSLLPQAGVSNPAELTRTLLGFSLWSFLGLLLLPTISRWGVFEADQQARAMGVSEAEFNLTVRELDQLQDDEARRSSGVETIFHPVPSVENRLARFRSATPAWGAWNAARYALFLSWPCLGLLSRAVHCNSGRPELWVMLPVD
jgi:hypothetical protein